jgi:hypothetical protein
MLPRTEQILNVILKLKENERQYDMFKKGIFGHFVQMKCDKYQKQILHHMVLRRIPSESEDELWFNFNGNVAKFGIKEFALMTGLNCNPFPNIKLEGDKFPNTLGNKFFPGTKKVKLEQLKVVSIPK